MKYFPWIAAAFVAIVVITAFFVIGSPMRERLVRFDERRLRDLQDIQYQVSRYFAVKGRLPASLEDLNGLESMIVPVDPETGGPYEYVVKGPMEFQLCARFALQSDEKAGEQPFVRSWGPTMPGPEYIDVPRDSWRHPAGHGCFDNTLEKPVADGSQALPPVVTVKPSA